MTAPLLHEVQDADVIRERYAVQGSSLEVGLCAPGRPLAPQLFIYRGAIVDDDATGCARARFDRFALTAALAREISAWVAENYPSAPN